MKVLHVNHLLDPVLGGGTAERTFQLGRELAASGASCTILTLAIGEAASRADGIDGLRVEAVPCLNRRFFLPRISPARVDALVREADVVQLFGNWTALNWLVGQACARQGKPFVFCPAGALPPFGRSMHLKRLYTRLVARRLIRDAAACICITPDERQHFLQLGAEAGKLHEIPNGIDPRNYRLADEPRQVAQFRQDAGVGDAPYLLFLGRLNAIKGPDLLLEAFGSVAPHWPALHLVLGGPDAGMLAPLRQRARDLGLQDRVHFPGFVRGPSKAAALRGAQLLAIPSRSEAMSIVVLEAGACGCPVLFTDACGVDTFERQGAGTMVAVDAAAIASGLQRLLAEPGLRQAQGQKLQDVVTRDYLWQSQASRHRALYEGLLIHRPATRPQGAPSA